MNSLEFDTDKHYLCIMASDSPEQNLTQYFSLCNDFIHAARLRDGNVLIHWRRLKERYPSLALADSDLAECRVMLDSYQLMLRQKTICEGKCAMGRQCPTGVCRTGSKRQPRSRRPSAAGGGPGGGEPGAGGLTRSPSTLSTTSTTSGYRPRSSPAGLYSYTGPFMPESEAVDLQSSFFSRITFSFFDLVMILQLIVTLATSRPTRSTSGLSVTRVRDAVGGGTAMAVGGSEYSRRRAASAPATPALSPASSPPASPHRAPHRKACAWIIPSVKWMDSEDDL
ncbi:hypothetical protein RR46_09187 [Papilio xuthus]|uniref:Uncharacterized protein n=1 Tax=Papilio xuthus TaxID=66420 RepID=A0A194Q1K3_PAPXU|nr:hypothetical protein RR46_09187 [Papilio xuthus]